MRCVAMPYDAARCNSYGNASGMKAAASYGAVPCRAARGRDATHRILNADEACRRPGKPLYTDIAIFPATVCISWNIFDVVHRQRLQQSTFLTAFSELTRPVIGYVRTVST